MVTENIPRCGVQLPRRARSAHHQPQRASGALCCVTLRCVVLRCVVLCCVVLRCVVLHQLVCLRGLEGV
eukprot:9164171-Pyramimonas_sp.AAC.1